MLSLSLTQLWSCRRTECQNGENSTARDHTKRKGVGQRFQFHHDGCKVSVHLHKNKSTCSQSHRFNELAANVKNKQQQKQLWNDRSTAMCDRDICLQRFLWFCCQTEIYIYIKCTKNNADLLEVKTTFPWNSQSGKLALWGSISPWQGAA